MKKYLLSAICLLFLSSTAHALDLSRVKTWAASEILTAADLNGEFNNILNHSLTNNDIDAAAGIVGSKLNLSSPGIIGATTPAAATYTTLTINSTSIFKDKMSFTQTDNLEYIDSLADGYLDFEATTGLRWRINATEQINLTDGLLAPTTDDDIDLGSTTKEFKDLWIDGTANIDSLVADTADINAGTMDGVQIGGTTATGELIVNDASDYADGLGSQGTAGQVLESQGIGVLPQFASVIDNYDDGTIQEGNTLSTERSTSSATYAVLKQTTPLPRKGTISVNWEMKNNDGVSTVYSKVYVNSVAVGVEKTTTNNTYIGTFTDTAISVAAGDIVQIYGKTSGGATVYIKNVKILCANPTTIIEASGL